MPRNVTPIRLGIPRHEGPLASMGVGRWMSDPKQHRPAKRLMVWFSCPSCGAVTDVDPEDVGRTGDVAGEFICQEVKCDFVRNITLSGWGEPVFDTTDVTP